jgi:hypothetical protein
MKRYAWCCVQTCDLFFKTLKCTWGTKLNMLFLLDPFHYPKDISDWRIKTLNQTFRSRYKNLKSYKVPGKKRLGSSLLGLVCRKLLIVRVHYHKIIPQPLNYLIAIPTPKFKIKFSLYCNVEQFLTPNQRLLNLNFHSLRTFIFEKPKNKTRRIPLKGS